MVPFQIALRDAKPTCVMASYSKINGVYASNNKKLLNDILRKEWGFEGLVMSDWFGVNSIVPSVEAGLDLEMPGPARKRGKNLIDAVSKGYMKESTMDINVRRILELVFAPPAPVVKPHMLNLFRSTKPGNIRTQTGLRSRKKRSTDRNTRNSFDGQLLKESFF